MKTSAAAKCNETHQIWRNESDKCLPLPVASYTAVRQDFLEMTVCACTRMHVYVCVCVCACRALVSALLSVCCAFVLCIMTFTTEHIYKKGSGRREKTANTFLPLSVCVCVCVLRCVWACTWLQVFPLLLHNIRTWQKPTPYSTIEKHRGSNITHQRRAVITVWKQSLEKNTNHHIHEGNLK